MVGKCLHPLDPPDILAPIEAVSAAPTHNSRPCFDPASGQAVNAQIVARDQLAVGMGIEGPALIVEDETTIVLPASRRAVAAADGAIDVRIKGQGVPTPSATS